MSISAADFTDYVDFFNALMGYSKEPIVCDTIPELESFDAVRYMGNWFEIQHVKDEGFQPNSWKCNQASYTDLDAEGNFKVYNSSQAFIGPRFGVHGQAKCPAETGPGQCFVKFFFQKFDTPNYQIIATDYDNYSVIYACHETSKAFLWIMSRTPTLSDELLKQAQVKAALTLQHFDFDNMLTDVQGEENGCKYVANESEAIAERFLF